MSAHAWEKEAVLTRGILFVTMMVAIQVCLLRGNVRVFKKTRGI